MSQAARKRDAAICRRMHGDAERRRLEDAHRPGPPAALDSVEWSPKAIAEAQASYDLCAGASAALGRCVSCSAPDGEFHAEECRFLGVYCRLWRLKELSVERTFACQGCGGRRMVTLRATAGFECRCGRKIPYWEAQELKHGATPTLPAEQPPPMSLKSKRALGLTMARAGLLTQGMRPTQHLMSPANYAALQADVAAPKPDLWPLAEPDDIKIKIENGKIERWKNHGTGPDITFPDPNTAPVFVGAGSCKVCGCVLDGNDQWSPKCKSCYQTWLAKLEAGPP
jgi:hypothetical protein